MSVLVGTPSDDVPAMLANGGTNVTTMYVSMSARHPDGHDADYLEWHSLDHRPEQHRLASLRASFRIVSTPACRAARAASDERYAAADHVMNYFFTDIAGLPSFNDLNMAMIDAGRTPYLLPLVERAVYRLDGAIAAPRVKVGADVLPWWPAKGVYLLVERGEASPAPLVDVPGVGGLWWGGAAPMEPPYTTRDNAGLQIAYCFLDEDPATVGDRLKPVLEKRWQETGLEPLLAAPFHTLVSYDWGRFLP
ncbi:conserved hypothetical protein [Parafrankia sp. EAN1pec]|nr:conserved hypothetical protein [Frankia sp. EAN1pec]